MKKAKSYYEIQILPNNWIWSVRFNRGEASGNTYFKNISSGQAMNQVQAEAQAHYAIETHKEQERADRERRAKIIHIQVPA